MTRIKTAAIALAMAASIFLRSCYQEYKRLDRFAENCSPTYEGWGG